MKVRTGSAMTAGAFGPLAVVADHPLVQAVCLGIALTAAVIFGMTTEQDPS